MVIKSNSREKALLQSQPKIYGPFCLPGSDDWKIQFFCLSHLIKKVFDSITRKKIWEGSVVIKGHLMNKVFALITAKKGGHFQRNFYLNHSEKDKSLVFC